MDLSFQPIKPKPIVRMHHWCVILNLFGLFVDSNFSFPNIGEKLHNENGRNPNNLQQQQQQQHYIRTLIITTLQMNNSEMKKLSRVRRSYGV